MATLDWDRVVDIFHRLRTEPPGRRTEILGALDDASPAMRAEVASLLEAHDQAGGFMDAVTADPTAKHRPLVPVRQRVGERIGPYRLLREIGRGGMGQVFLAERVDTDYQRVVALKLLDPELVPGTFLRRFRIERQILARLSHPHIAHLYEGGSAPDGALYFAMELIDGEPIVDYCDRRRLGIDARLALVEQVCDAVQHAHASLVIHRDLKPSNILVDRDGQVKLLDFGIAKLLVPEEGASVASPTRSMMQVLTPRYASPEQARGEPVTTASDVFSLGVVLYQMLVGRVPARPPGWSDPSVPKNGLVEVERPSLAVLHRQPAAGGGDGTVAETEARRRAKRLRGDLDTIVLECLRAEPTRRYGSVGQLAQDVSRFRAGLPVEARADSWHYRASKLIRRNRLATVVGALAVVVLVGAVVALASMAVRLAAERDEARVERQKAGQVADLLVELFDGGNPVHAHDSDVTVREVLEGSLPSVRERLADQPEVEAALLDAIGRLYMGLGLYEQASEPLDRALALRRAQPGGDVTALVEALINRGNVRRAQGRLERAAVHFREAEAVLAAAPAPDPVEVAVVASYLGEILIVAGRYDEAEPRVTRAVELARAQHGEASLAYARTLVLQGKLLMLLDRLDEARPVLEHALVAHRSTLGTDHGETQTLLRNLALLQRDQGDYAAASRLYEQILETERRIYPARHPRLAMTLSQLGLLHADRGDYAAAEPLVEEGLAMRRQLLGPHHIAVVVSLNAVGKVRYMRGDPAASAVTYAQCLETARTGGLPPKPTSHCLLGLGRARVAQGRAGEGESYLREALAIRQRAFAPDHVLTVEAQLELGRCLIELGSMEEAVPLVRAARGQLLQGDARTTPVLAPTLAVLDRLLPDGDSARPEPGARVHVVHSGQ